MSTSRRQVSIYAISDPATNLVRYVGKSVDPRKRLSAHACDQKGNKRLREWIKALGRTPPISILEVAPVDGWEEREKFWIKHFRSGGQADFNFLDGGNDFPPPSAQMVERIAATHRGRKRSDDTRARMHAAQVAIWSNPERRSAASAVARKRFSDPNERLRMSELARKRFSNPNERARMSEIARRAMANPDARLALSILSTKRQSDPLVRLASSLRMRGRKASEETRKKLSLAQIERFSRPGERERMSGALKGRTITDEHRKRISSALTGRKPSPEHRERAIAALQRQRR